jgi:secondary thiamine-phosphate synthase enzyme
MYKAEEIIKTSKREEIIDITELIKKHIKLSNIKDGVCALFVPHTTCGVTINENADPSVKSDFLNQMKKLIPQQGNYLHSEGNSDAHIKSILVGPSLTLLVWDGQLVLGTWQGVYFCEFDGPRNRKLLISIL